MLGHDHSVSQQPPQGYEVPLPLTPEEEAKLLREQRELRRAKALEFMIAIVRTNRRLKIETPASLITRYGMDVYEEACRLLNNEAQGDLFQSAPEEH